MFTSFRASYQLKGEAVAVREMRKHASWYLKGIRGNGKARNAINQTETAPEFRALLNDLVQDYEENESKLIVPVAKELIM